LADLGARVIKVEEPRLGDPVRRALPARDGVGGLAAILLSGVESVALDLKLEAGQEVLRHLLERADVLLESFRPGTLERLGFSHRFLRERFPRLILCSVSGWGQTGPYAPKAGHDLTYQALAGTLASTAAMPAVPVADLAGAWGAVSAVLAALYERERTGAGRHLDAGLYDAALHSNLIGWAVEGGGPRPVGRPLPLSGALPCYNVYRTSDGGWLAIGALERHFWERFCRLVGREDLKGKLYSPGARREVAGIVRGKSREDWERLLAGQDLPVEPLLSAGEAKRHPQALDRAVLSTGEDGLPRLGFPVRFDGERPQGLGRVPEVGSDTGSLLAELGLSRKGRHGRDGVGARFSWRRLLLGWVRR
jgi:crotonobetainyl-CoA:carnitine CoA-transferase CaiB-like acyl-CoA transferase